MKRYESNYNPAVRDISDYIHEGINDRGIDPVMATKIKNVLDGVEVTDNLLVQKEQLLGQKDTQLNQLQQTITTKTAEVQSKDSLLVQKEAVIKQKTDQIVTVTQEKLKIAQEKAKVEIHNKKVTNVVHNNIKKEYISVLQQLNPNVYSGNYEEWSGQAQGAKNLIDQNDIKKISKKLVSYKIQLSNKIAKEKLEQEQKFKNLNDTFTTTEEIRIQKEQEIERLRELLAQKDIEIQNKDLLRDELLTQKELENQEKERLREELARKEVEAQEKDALLLVKESEVHNKSAEKNRIIEELASSLLTREEEILTKNLNIGELSHKVKKTYRKSVAKDKEIEALKVLIEQARIEKEEVITKQELALANKSHMKNQIIDELEEEINLQEDEVGNLRVQNLEKELMNQKQEKLLIQKESELADKSFVKNQVIASLQEDIGLKEKEAYKLQIELLTKQLELKDKALEEARIINELREKEAADAHLINELQGKLLELKALYGHDVSFSQEFSAIQFRAENSVANNDFDAIGELARYIGDLLEAERENSGTGDFSTLLANISPIPHPVAVNNAGNIDIYNQPIYRSIYIEDRSVQPGSSLLERQMESLDSSSMMNQDRQNQAVQPGNSLIALEQMPVPLNQGNIMNHGAQNQDLIGNFDNQHITTSVALGGEGSESFEII